MRYLLLLVIILQSVSLQSQQFSVKSFKVLPRDMTARSEFVVMDQNGFKAPLIKLVTNLKKGDFSFDDGMLSPVQVDQKKAEIWIYMPEGARFLTIQAENQGVIRRYEFSTGVLQEATTYEMVLTTAKVTTIVEQVIESQWVTISSTPSGADVFIDGNNTGKQTPFQAELLLGAHEYKLAKEKYIASSGSFTLTSLKKENLNEVLVPNFATISLSDNSKNSLSKYYINGILQEGFLPQKVELATGKYILKVENPQYTSQKKVITVAPNQSQDVSFDLQGKYGSLKIVSTPFNATITLNGKDMGTTPNTLRNLLIGSYTLELALEGYGTLKKTIDIKEGVGTDINEQLTEETVATTIDTKGYAPAMVFVEGGSFMMGCTSEQSDCDDNEKPAHRVELNSFSMSSTEVTQAQYQKVMGENPSYNKAANNPVERVSWYDAVAYCKKLSILTDKRFRLPTEAEWEYAARGGQKSKGYQYLGSSRPGNVGWNRTNSRHKTHEVGKKQPNELGLYDMSGNVWEWCSDWYGEEYYKESSADNPTGPATGRYRVLRGGSCYSSAWDARVAYRYNNAPGNRNFPVAFRVVSY